MPEDKQKLSMRLILSVDKNNALVGIAKAEKLTEELNWELNNLRSMFSCEEEKADDLKQDIK